jgi:hypothetical protein
MAMIAGLYHIKGWISVTVHNLYKPSKDSCKDNGWYDKAQSCNDKPFHPALSWPIWIAISVLLGPGIKFVAPIKSKNVVLQAIFFSLLPHASEMCAATSKPIISI